jgi:hypothetical protein
VRRESHARGGHRVPASIMAHGVADRALVGRFRLQPENNVHKKKKRMNEASKLSDD